MKSTAAKTTDDLRAIIDDLDAAIKKALEAKSDRELNHANHELGLAFRGLQYGVMTVASDVRKKVDSRHAELRYNR